MTENSVFREDTVGGLRQNAAPPLGEGMEGLTIVGGRFIVRFSIAAVSVHFRQFGALSFIPPVQISLPDVKLTVNFKVVLSKKDG